MPLQNRDRNIGLDAEALAKRLRLLDEAVKREGPPWNLRTSTGYFPRVEDEAALKVTWNPKVISGAEWDQLARGVTQRAQVINQFLSDVYAGRPVPVPAHIIRTSPFYHPLGRNCAQPYYANFYGPDIVRDTAGNWVVLEDNLGLVGGLPDMVQVRSLTRRFLPELFSGLHIRDYKTAPLLDALREQAADRTSDPTIVVLTKHPGLTAYFDHRRFSQILRAPLVEPRDLVLRSDGVFLRTNRELVRVDVILKRILPTNEYLPGISEAAAARKVSISSFAGSGLFMDKAVFAYVPQLIKHYLDQDPLLMSPATYPLSEPEWADKVFRNPSAYVLKRRGGFGGHEVMVGPLVDRSALEAALAKVRANPHEWVAQEFIDYQTMVADLVGEPQPCLTDFRLFVVIGNEVTVLPGGMSRWAPVTAGKVNVAGGGAVRDIWVADEEGNNRNEDH